MLLGLWLGALALFSLSRRCYANSLDTIGTVGTLKVFFIAQERRLENFLSGFGDGLERTGNIENCLIEASEIWEKTVKNENKEGDHVEARDQDQEPRATRVVANDIVRNLRNVMFPLLQGLNTFAVRWLHAYLAFAVVVCSLAGLYFWSFLFVTFVFDGSELVRIPFLSSELLPPFVLFLFYLFVPFNFP
jgi:hypothetical protein